METTQSIYNPDLWASGEIVLPESGIDIHENVYPTTRNRRSYPGRFSNPLSWMRSRLLAATKWLIA